MELDATTILAVLSCAVVFAGWLVLPHSAAVPRVAHSTEVLEPVHASAR
jgi:hypothetical protein